MHDKNRCKSILKGCFVRYLLLVLLTLNLFAVDATLTIEKDVEQRARIALEDASSFPDENIFHMFVSDLKISGHFLVDPVHHQGSFDAAVLDPALKAQEYVLKYNLRKASGTKLTIRLILHLSKTK